MKEFQTGYHNAAVREPQTTRAAVKKSLLDVYSLPVVVTKRNCVSQTLEIDAYIGFVGPDPNPFPCWALLVIVGKAIGLVSRQLCPKCDKGAITSKRAILRATQTLLRFVHDISLPQKPGILPRPLSLMVKSRYGRLFRDIPSPRRPHYALLKQITALRACLNSNGSIVTYVPEKRNSKIQYATEAAHALKIEGPQTVCLSCKEEYENTKELCQHFRTNHMKERSCGIHSNCLKLSELLEDKCFLSITGSGTPLSIS